MDDVAVVTRESYRQYCDRSSQSWFNCLKDMSMNGLLYLMNAIQCSPCVTFCSVGTVYDRNDKSVNTFLT